MPWATSRESVEQNLMVCPGWREHTRSRIYFSSVLPSSWFTVSSSHRGRTDCRSPVTVLCSRTNRPIIAIVKGEIITPIWWTRRTKTRWIKKKIRKGENIRFSNRQRSRVAFLQKILRVRLAAREYLSFATRELLVLHLANLQIF